MQILTSKRKSTKRQISFSFRLKFAAFKVTETENQARMVLEQMYLMYALRYLLYTHLTVRHINKQ